jgi:hypothetical protein
MKLSRTSFSQIWIAPVAFAAALAFTPSMRCQKSTSPGSAYQDTDAAATSSTGVVSDWSHHHVVYSHPGAANGAQFATNPCQSPSLSNGCIMGFTARSSCAQNLAIGNFTLCGEAYNDVSTAGNVTVDYSPSPNNAIIAWATWCFTSACNTSISGITATIGDNINATESCFVASPHSPFITDGNGGAQGSGDFQQHYVWYCPSIPSGVTSFTVTPTNPNLSYLQLNITEWKAGSLAPSCSPISACFENVDNLGQAGNSTGGTTATITTSGPTVNANDLIFAVTEVPCCSFTASPGTGYTGITVAPAVTPGMVSEAKAATNAGIQTATSTWTGGSTSWFGVIVPVITVNSGAATTATLTATPNPAFTGSQVTLTATVTSGGNPVSAGTVTFTENGAAPAGASSNVVDVNGSGLAAITTSALVEGDHNIVASYSGVTNTYGTSQTSLWVRENTASTVTASGATATFCNPGGFTLPNQAESADNIGAAAPNPSNIFVANMPGTISSVSLELENFQTNPNSDTIYYTSSLLVGPGATTANTLDFFSGTGTTDNETELAKGNYIFTDNASELVPQTDFGPASYLPTSYDTSGIKGTYTASPSGFYALPSSFNYAAPRGSSTFNSNSGSVFGDTNPNGTWSLYFYQNFSVVTTQATASAWCLDFVENLPAVSVTVPGTGTFTQGQQGASFTVDVEDNGPGSTGDPSGGSNPMTVTDALNPALSYAGFTGSGWNCSASGQNVSCTNDSPDTESSSYPELTIDVNVSGTASGSISNSVTVSGGGAASTASNTDTITIDTPPVITSAGSTTFNVGTSGTFTVTANGYPAPTFSETGPLPSGVTLTSGGVLAGTPAAGTGGSYPITFTASNGVSPNATQSFTLTVDQSPAITSASSTTFILGSADSFTVTATGYPAPTYSVTGTLPSGVTLTSGGVLAGTPGAGTSGTYPITITASNGVSPNTTQSFTLTVGSPTPIVPYIQDYEQDGGAWQNVSSLTVNLGDTVNLGPQPATGGSWSWTGPSNFTSSSRQLNGVYLPSATNVYAATFTNAAGVASTEAFTITVAPTPITPYLQVNGAAWQGTNTVTVAAGSSVNLGPQASGNGSWSWSGPSYTAGTQQINNIPLNSASNVFTATFTNAAGVASTETFTITIAPTTITPYLEVNGGAWQGTNSVTVAVGSSVDLGPQAAGSGTWNWSGPGFTSSAREIDGIALNSPSNVYIATFTNAAGVASTGTFTIMVAPTSITPYLEVNGGAWQATNNVTVAAGGSVSLGPQAAGSGTWSWSGPSYTASTRQVNNIPLTSASNVYTATFTNAAGVISTEAFTITVAPTTITPYLEVNGGAWQGTNSVTVAVGSSVDLGPQAAGSGTWSWSGPDFTSSARKIDGIALNSPSNVYIATFTNAAGVISTETFTITIAPTTITPYIEVNNAAWQATNSITVTAGSTVNLGPQPVNGGSWSWAGPNGYESSSRQINGIPLSVGSNTYMATYTNPAGVTSTETFTITVE